MDGIKMAFPKFVKLVDVAPRDGLQNESVAVSTEVKLELIERLVDAGIKAIEATAFVSPKWVPLMADHAEVIAGIKPHPGVHYSVLAPNVKGLEAAIAAGAKEVAVFPAASNAFNLKNLNCTLEESMARVTDVCNAATKAGIAVRGYVSCALGCPFDGDVAPELVAELATELTRLGCYEIAIGDTIGVGTPGKARAVVEEVAKYVPMENLATHFHDTYGQALANIYAALEVGLSVVDCSVGGLGGCPYAPGAAGNVATEDVLYMLDGMGIETGVDLQKIIATSWYITEKLGRTPSARVSHALHNKAS